jgi:hypothetical protein
MTNVEGRFFDERISVYSATLRIKLLIKKNANAMVIMRIF